MRRARHQLVRRQTSDDLAVPSASGLEGGATATSVTITNSLLVDSSASSPSSGSDALDSSASANTITSSSTAPSGSTSTSPALDHPSIATGAVIGIAVAVFLVTVAAMFAMYAFFNKRSLAQARRPVTRGSPPAVREGAVGNSKNGQRHQMRVGRDRSEGSEKSFSGLADLPRSKTPDSDKFALFEKDPSVRSLPDDRTSVSDTHSFDPSTMPNFAKYQPDLGEPSTARLPPFAPRADGSHIMSWDSETINGGSLLSLRTSPSDTMSPTAVIARQTPPATDSAQHHWESAEVLIMDERTTVRSSIYSQPSVNPFSDDAAARENNDTDSQTSPSNPFFNASRHTNSFSDRSSRPRKSSVSAIKRSRSYSASTTGTVRAGADSNALLSLIAALNAAPTVLDNRSSHASMQSMATSVESSAVPTIPKAF